LGYLISRIFREQPLRFSLSVLTLALAGMLEGAGIATLVPMLQIVGQQTASTASLGRAGSAILAVLTFLHMPFNLATVLAFTLFFILASQATVLAQQKLLAGSSALLDATMRRKLFGAVLEAGWPYFVQTKSTDLTSTLLADTARAGMAYVTIVTVIGTIIMVVIYLGLALLLSWPMTLATLATSGAVLVLLRNRTSRGTKYGQEISRVDAEIYGETQENLVAAKLIKASSAENQIIERFDRLTAVRQRIQYKNLMNQAWLKTTYDSASVATVFVGVYIAVTFFGMTISTLTVFLFLFYRLSPRVSNLQASASLTLSLIPGVRRVDEYTANAQRLKEDSGSTPLGPLTREILLEDVSFAYGETGIIQHVTLSIPRGASTAIVGPSGSGKTTLMDIVLGLLQPQSGRVLVDGVSLAGARMSDWRRQIGYVAQDSSFFHASIAENISMGRTGLTLADVQEASRLAHADEFVSDLPEGYDTLIGDRGVRLSGGQRQRLALARALAGRPSILVLDEATSALDAESEEKIQRAVDGLAGSMTILTVTHRLATVKNADLIYVLEDGVLAESGSWSSLLSANGRFSELVRMQSIGQPSGSDG
jgi:ABC-type multidrug transport system fused ATPase/permease subunit